VDKVEGGFGIAGADGERWKRSRRLAWTSLFTTDRLKKFSTLLETESSLMEEYLSKCASTGVPIDPTSMFPNYTLRIISSMAFGKPLGYYDESTRDTSNTTLSDPTKQINTIFSYLSAKFMHERLVPLFRRLPWAQYPHFRADVTNLWSMLDGLVSEAEHKHQSGSGSSVPRSRIVLNAHH
jgi:cytochrome P450